MSPTEYTECVYGSNDETWIIWFLLSAETSVVRWNIPVQRMFCDRLHSIWIAACDNVAQAPEFRTPVLIKSNLINIYCDYHSVIGIVLILSYPQRPEVHTTTIGACETASLAQCISTASIVLTEGSYTVRPTFPGEVRTRRPTLYVTGRSLKPTGHLATCIQSDVNLVTPLAP